MEIECNCISALVEVEECQDSPPIMPYYISSNPISPNPIMPNSFPPNPKSTIFGVNYNWTKWDYPRIIEPSDLRYITERMKLYVA